MILRVPPSSRPCSASSGRVVFLDPWQGQLNELKPGPGYLGGGRFEQVVRIGVVHLDVNEPMGYYRHHGRLLLG
jgi:hypothetical protein